MCNRPICHIIARTKSKQVAGHCAEYINERFSNCGVLSQWDSREGMYLIRTVTEMSVYESSGFVEAARAFIAGRNHLGPTIELEDVAEVIAENRHKIAISASGRTYELDRTVYTVQGGCLLIIAKEIE